jgi:hypothetical protein
MSLNFTRAECEAFVTKADSGFYRILRKGTSPRSATQSPCIFITDTFNLFIFSNAMQMVRTGSSLALDV